MIKFPINALMQLNGKASLQPTKQCQFQTRTGNNPKVQAGNHGKPGEMAVKTTLYATVFLIQ